MGSKRGKFTIVLLASILLIGSASAQTTFDFGVNDFNDFGQTLKNSTSAFENFMGVPNPLANSTFTTHTIEIITSGGDGGEEAKGSFNYNVTGPNGNLVNNVTGTEITIGQGNTTGIYYIWNETADERTRIDVFSGASNAAGRVNGASNPSNVDVDLYYWTNGSEINFSSKNSFNVSKTSWATNEIKYSLNTTKNDYWIAMNDSGSSTPYELKKSRSQQGGFQGSGTKYDSFPRINDFILGSSSLEISGQVVNTDGNAVQGLQIRLERYTGLNSNRIPYLTGPPQRTDITNSKGHYNFSGLKSGEKYELRVTNFTHANWSKSSFNPTLTLQNSMHNVDFNVTNKTSNVTLKIEGTGKYRYGVGFLNGDGVTPKYEKIEAVKAGTSTFEGIPAGRVYGLNVFKFDKNGKFLQAKFDRVTPAENTDPGPIKIGFPPLIYFNGTVNPNSGGLDGARIILENRTEGKFYFGKTDSNGDFSIKVQNNTRYKVRVTPPFDKSDRYRINKTNVTISKPFNDTKNFTLSDGKTLAGFVNDSQGNPVEARVFVGNSSKLSFGRDITDSDGYYNISGLEGIRYNVRVFPQNSIYNVNKTELTVSSGTDITQEPLLVVSEQKKLNGTIVDSGTQNGLKANVTVRSNDGSIKETYDTGSNGEYSFSTLPKDLVYTVDVNPVDGSYQEKRKIVELDSNTTLNFSLTATEIVDGYVEDNSGNAIDGASIVARNRSVGSTDSDVTDSNGYYNLNLTQERHEIQIKTDGNLVDNVTSIAKQDVDSHALDKNYTVPTGKTLEGNVTGLSDYTNIDGYINLRNSSQDASGYTEFTNGDYSITGLKDVRYEAYISTDNQSYRDNTTVVKVSDLGTVRNFTLANNTDGRRVGITVQEEGGSVIQDAKVYALGNTYITNSNGKVEIPRLGKDVNFTVNAEASGYQSATRNVSVKSKTVSTTFGTSTVNWQNYTLSLKNLNTNSFDLEVNLTYDKGDDSGRSVIFRSNESGNSLTESSVTGNNGKTTIESLVTGSYLATIVIGENEVNSTAVDLKRGESQTLNVDPNYDLWYSVPPK